MSDRLLPSGQWLKDRLSTRWVGKSEIIYEEEISSTNTLLKELARQGASAGTVAVCDFQSAGRGRNCGRVYHRRQNPAQCGSASAQG